jgi:hypothetical protein
VLYLSNPKGVDNELQRDSLDSIRRLNHRLKAGSGDWPFAATQDKSRRKKPGTDGSVHARRYLRSQLRTRGQIRLSLVSSGGAKRRSG